MELTWLKKTTSIFLKENGPEYHFPTRKAAYLLARVISGILFLKSMLVTILPCILNQHAANISMFSIHSHPGGRAIYSNASQKRKIARIKLAPQPVLACKLVGHLGKMRWLTIQSYLSTEESSQALIQEYRTQYSAIDALIE